MTFDSLHRVGTCSNSKILLNSFVIIIMVSSPPNFSMSAVSWSSPGAFPFFIWSGALSTSSLRIGGTASDFLFQSSFDLQSGLSLYCRILYKTHRWFMLFFTLSVTSEPSFVFSDGKNCLSPSSFLLMVFWLLSNTFLTILVLHLLFRFLRILRIVLLSSVYSIWLRGDVCLRGLRAFLFSFNLWISSLVICAVYMYFLSFR